MKVEVQCKDLPPTPAFSVRMEFEGAPHDPTLIRFHAEDLGKTSGAEETKEHVYTWLA